MTLLQSSIPYLKALKEQVGGAGEGAAGGLAGAFDTLGENITLFFEKSEQGKKIVNALTNSINFLSNAFGKFIPDVRELPQTMEGVQKAIKETTVDEEVSEVLVQEGFTSLEEIAYVPLDEILAIEGFDEEIANELRNRAKDALLTQAIASEENLSSANIADDLLNLEGMDDALALALAKIGILSMEDLAEQSIDELMEIDDMDEERAGKLIMTARAPWFEEE